VVRTGDTGHLVWSKLVGGTNAEWWDVAEIANGFLLTGRGMMAKLDPDGSLVWAKALPGNGVGYRGTATQDGSIVVAGAVNNQAFLLKTDAAGSFQWGWTYGESSEARSVVELPAGGFMVFGSTQSLGAGGSDLLFFATDASGTLQWAKTAGGAADDKDSLLPYRMIGTNDGGFVVATSTQSFGSGGDIFVVKLNASAEVMWANTYGAGVAEAIAQTLHGYLVLGTHGQELLMGLDSDGNPQWARQYGDVPFHNYVGGGASFDGGGFLVTESHLNPVNTHKFLLIKTDADGRTQCNDETSFSVTANKVSLTTAAVTLTANALSGPLSPVGVGVRDGGLVDRVLCSSIPVHSCKNPIGGLWPAR
jgi:hypothetical protein